MRQMNQSSQFMTLLRCDRGIGVLDQHLDILVKPGPSLGRAGHAALAVALPARLDPHQAVYERVVRDGPRLRAEARRGYVTPVAPFLAGAGLCDAALVDDEARGQSLGLEMRRQRRGVVRLIPRLAVLGEVLPRDGVEGVVVRDVGREAADLGVVARLPDDLGEELGG